MTSLYYPDVCKDCGGKCCGHHPHVMTHEKDRILETHPEIEFDPVMDGWWKMRDDCPLFDPVTGCALDMDDRPMICRVFPFSPIRRTNGWILLLDVSDCPHWTFFGTKYGEAVNLFVSLTQNTPAATHTVHKIEE